MTRKSTFIWRVLLFKSTFLIKKILNSSSCRALEYWNYTNQQNTLIKSWTRLVKDILRHISLKSTLSLPPLYTPHTFLQFRIFVVEESSALTHILNHRLTRLQWNFYFPLFFSNEWQNVTSETLMHNFNA